MQTETKNVQTITGTVYQVKQRDKGYSVKIKNEWISGWGKTELKEGDQATVSYTVNDKGYNDIVKKDEAGDFQKPDPKSIAQTTQHTAYNQKEQKWKRVPVKEVVDRRNEALEHAIDKLPKLIERMERNNVKPAISTIETILGILYCQG